MSKQEDNKAVVGRWFTEFWGDTWNPKIVDELAAPDILLQYSLHELCIPTIMSAHSGHRDRRFRAS